MKRLKCTLLTILFLTALVLPLPEGIVRAFAAEETPLTEASGSREAWSVLSFTADVNEVSNEVESTLILENTGNETVTADLKLPRVSAGIQKGSLQVTASGNALRLTEDELRLTLEPGKNTVLSYRYLTKDPLIHARVIGMDFKTLVFREGGRIGHFRISVTLREEDLPLVEEVFPVNFTLEEKTVSVELFDVSPSSLLDRFSRK